MRRLTVSELLTATGGTLLAGGVSAAVTSVSTDSRKAGEGALFIPLTGERFDGHDYIDKALALGAAGCLCARTPAAFLPDKFYIAVPDTRLALKALASWYRGQFNIPVVQITGSVGKTTTKEMIASVVSQRYRTLKTAENFNNDIGTPLTLLGLDDTYEAAVIETGMDHFGEIRYLGEMVRPHIAVITNIGDAHIEFLGSREGILKAKSEIFENLDADGVAILNGDDALLDTVALPQRIVRCGESAHADVRVSALRDRGIDGIACTVTTARAAYHLRIPAPGRHMIYAASLAAAVGEELGLSVPEIERGVALYEPAGSRMRVHRLSGDRRLLQRQPAVHVRSAARACGERGQEDRRARRHERARRADGVRAPRDGRAVRSARHRPRHRCRRVRPRHRGRRARERRVVSRRGERGRCGESCVHGGQRPAVQGVALHALGEDRRGIAQDNMIEISVTGLQKSFDLEKKILDGLTFQINSGERVGLLGKNGAGKTTRFRIPTGEIDYDAGEVAIASDRRVGLISQIPVYPAGYTVEDVLQSAFERMRRMADEMERLSAQMAKGDESEETLRRYGELSARFEGLGGYDTATAVNKVANGLSIPADMRTRLFDTLSGGEKTRVNLGRLILEDTDILLLDEPTNHLDLHAIEWLEEYLASFKGTVVAISHDRYFLDRTITRVIEILDGHAEFYNGNYSFYAVEKERRYLEKMRQYEKEQAKIRQLEAAADKLHLWAFMGNDALHKRAFSMEKRIERMRTTDKPTREKKMTAQFRSSEFLGDEVLTLKGVGKSFGERTLFSGVDLKVAGGERIALIGDNGTGKSTLIKMIMGEEYPDEGRIKLGPSTKIAYLPQIIHFDVPQRNLVDTMLYSKRDITPQKARDRLAAFHFRGEDVFKSVSVLSGGEQSRLRLCMLMDDEVNFLILDEPTNHLDIASREWIEEAVEAFDGTLLFVSHDRYFINRFATRVWELEEQRITDYPMGFARYRKIKAEQSAKKAEPEKAVKEKSLTEKPQRGNKNQQAARRQLTICETGISKLEERCRQLDAEMEQNACNVEKLQELYREKQEVEARLEQEMARWEELSLQLEE